MKIQCDVCHKMEASVLCPADEAALCHACDRTIHHANKLAGKHTRFSLHHPNSNDSPLCDICQERRAYIFCREDRAILCRECDLSIHGVNEHTQKHNRFLLTGVKLCDSSSSSSSSDPTSLSSDRATTASPGYCMEDLLDASFPPNGLCKDYEFPLEVWSPPQSQVRSPQLSTCNNIHQNDDSTSVGVKEMPGANTVEVYSNWGYYGYTVPSISPPLIKKCKRSR